MTGMKASDQRRRWVNGCLSGKRGFLVRAGAKDAARLAAKGGSPGLRPYECDDCGYWHVGHKPTVARRGDVAASDWYEERNR